MTGNTKVWRAPLAGLASVAMIATMGVAAATANAANKWQYPDVTVTLDANGGSFADGSKTKSVTDRQDQYVDGYAYADGVIAGLYSTYANDSAIQWDAQKTRLFSGWYTEKQGGQAVDPTSALADGATLYAHWSQGAVDSDESEKFVKIDTKGEITYSADPDGSANVVNPTAGTVRLADGDTLADWELPTEDAKTNAVVPSWDESAVASAKAGQTLTPTLTSGSTVTVKAPTSYLLYKDGKNLGVATKALDVVRGDALKEYQAVKWTVGSRDAKLITSWQISYDGEGTWAPYTYGSNFDASSNTITVKAQGEGVNAQFVAVHKWSKSTTDLTYFVQKGQSFQATFGKTLEDVVRPNAQFLGWYDANETVTRTGFSAYNKDFFDANLIKDNGAKLWDKADPEVFDFNALLDKSIDLYAGYKNDARFTTITLDPNYSGADKISVKIYQGKKIADQLPTVTRDGYTLEGWYKDGKLYTGKLDTSKIADAINPISDTYYAKWSADSKFGVNGLLFNLARGYATARSADAAEGKSGQYYATFTNSPSKPVKLVKASKDANGVQLYKDAISDPSRAEFVLVNPGYVATTWDAFVKSRDEVVVPALIKELNLAKDADIATVYEAVATKLSAEKADEFNQLFSKVASDQASFPDVNYDDHGTHSDEITYLYKKGIVKGYADGTFGYGAPLARVDYIVWLYRAAGSPAVDAQSSFTDVTEKTVPNKDFRDAIAWAAANGITKGYSDGTFAPYATLNRQDAAAFLYRASGSPKFNESYADVKFGDVTPGDSANHSQAVLWAASNNIAKGYSGTVNLFSGYSTLVRQDAAAFLARTLQAGYIAK